MERTADLQKEILERKQAEAAMPMSWDPKRALENLGGDQQLLNEVIDIFIREGPKLVASLGEALAAGNAETVARFAHSLKGDLAYLGLLEASQKACRLEEMGRNGNLQNAAELIAHLERDVSRTLSEMQAGNANQNPAPAARAAKASS